MLLGGKTYFDIIHIQVILSLTEIVRSFKEVFSCL